MKKLIAGIVTFLALSTAAYAQHGHRGFHHHNHHRGHGHHWVGPLIGGVVLGAVIANSRSAQAEPVVVERPVNVNPVPPAPPILNPGVTYYNCLVRVYDPITNSYRNEVMTCVR
jgi:hypothetical protein